jgi:hypothetical protein
MRLELWRSLFAPALSHSVPRSGTYTDDLPAAVNKTSPCLSESPPASDLKTRDWRGGSCHGILDAAEIQDFSGELSKFPNYRHMRLKKFIKGSLALTYASQTQSALPTTTLRLSFGTKPTPGITVKPKEFDRSTIGEVGPTCGPS